MRLSKRQKQGLIDSIDNKWIPIYEGKLSREPKCPLCILYPANDCSDCPIKYFVGDIHCDETPYYIWRDAVVAMRSTIIRKPKANRHLALPELQFLINILPKKDRKPYQKYLDIEVV